jgi:FkbM family methyltransferase
MTFDILEPESLAHISKHWADHNPSSVWYQKMEKALLSKKPLIKSGLGVGNLKLGEIGRIDFGLTNLGNLDSSDLFGLDELILFSFYWKNRAIYQNFVDLGANIGLHTCVAGRLGYRVEAVEPDSAHFAILRANAKANRLTNLTLKNEAISSQDGEAGLVSFIRVLGNTTSSFVDGAKTSAYGKLEKLSVKARKFSDLDVKEGLVKVDIEGSEADLLCSLTPEEFSRFDFLVEIGSSENRTRIWDRIFGNNRGINFFPQKISWTPASRASDLPANYKEGSVFISTKSTMPW